MHKFFTKAQAQIDGYDNLPMLVDVARMYFDKTYCDRQHAEHFFQDYTEHFDDVKDFNLTDKVMLEALYSDTECWMPSPESMVADYFEGQGVAPEEAKALAQKFFTSLYEQLGEYAVTTIRNNVIKEIVILTGLSAANQLRIEKFSSVEWQLPENFGAKYEVHCNKVAYAK